MTEAAPQIRYPWSEAPAEGEAVEVAEGILWMRLPLPMKLDHVNIFALDDGEAGWTVIDSGMCTSRSREIWERLLAGPLGGRPVHRVMLTHYHPDHVGLVGWLMGRGAELWTTRTTYLLTRMLILDEQERWPQETLSFYRRAGMDPALFEKRSAQRPFNFADVAEDIPLGYRRMTEGEVVRMGGRDWTVRMGEGHAPEHATFWSTDGELVLCGDQLLPSISPNIGVHATEPEADPLSDWLTSCRRFSEVATTRQLVLPGHKLPYRGLPLRIVQLIENHHGALDRLETHLREPHTAGDSFLPLFGREIGEGEYGLALAEALAHCLHLWHMGRAERWLDGERWLFRTV